MNRKKLQFFKMYFKNSQVDKNMSKYFESRGKGYLFLFNLK